MHNNNQKSCCHFPQVTTDKLRQEFVWMQWINLFNELTAPKSRLINIKRPNLRQNSNRGIVLKVFYQSDFLYEETLTISKYSPIWQAVFKWGKIKLRIVETWQNCMVCLIWVDINLNMGWHYQAGWHQSQSCADCLEIPRQHSPFHSAHPCLNRFQCYG